MEFAKVEEDIQLLEKRQYSFVLFDGSLIQIIYLFRKRDIVRHNLSWYPPPVPFQADEPRMACAR